MMETVWKGEIFIGMCGEEKPGLVGTGEDDGGTPSPSSPPQPFPQVRHGDEGSSCSSGNPQLGNSRAIRRGRVHAVKARATASVISELARRVHRYERGEGGGVT